MPKSVEGQAFKGSASSPPSTERPEGENETHVYLRGMINYFDEDEAQRKWAGRHNQIVRGATIYSLSRTPIQPGQFPFFLNTDEVVSW